MITIRDVARQAGVSVATVSRVLNQSSAVTSDTRDAVLQAVEALGYRPNANAQALATQVSDTIGVVVMDVSDPFFGALVKAVDTVAQRVHKHVLISNSWHQEEKGITPVRTPALFCQGRRRYSVNCVTSMKTVTYNSATFVTSVIICWEVARRVYPQPDG